VSGTFATPELREMCSCPHAIAQHGDAGCLVPGCACLAPRVYELVDEGPGLVVLPGEETKP
jgi:hypothetical protein